MKKILEVRGQQAEDILSMLKCVATCDGTLELHEVHKGTLEAFAEHLFHVEVDVDALEGSIDGAADKVADPELRRDVMNMAGILPFLEEENKEARVDTFTSLGNEWGYDRKFARELHKLCHGSVVEVSICQIRPLLLASNATFLKGLAKMGAGFVHLDGDKKMLARYQGYQDLDDGIFGKVMTDYYRDNHFPLPGTAGAVFSNTLRFHDMHHVLAGYPTTPLGETCVIAYDDGLMEDGDLGKALIGYVAQFQVAIQFDKGLEVWRNQFDPELVVQAFERGGNCTANYETVDFDFDSLLEEPLDDIRERFNISMDGAIIKGPDDLWCGDMGIVGMRKSPDMIEHKKSWFEKLLAAGHDVTD